MQGVQSGVPGIIFPLEWQMARISNSVDCFGNQVEFFRDSDLEKNNNFPSKLRNLI